MRVTVIGVGGIGALHLNLIKDIPEYELVSVCDNDAAFVAAAAEKHGVPAFSDPGEAFALAECAIIATPPATHFDLVLRAVGAGLHVYCEKPIAPTAKAGYAMADAAKAAGVKAQVGFQHRFQFTYAESKRLIDAGALGEIYRANLFAQQWYRPQAYFDVRPWRGQWAASGGGVMMTQAVHQMDAFIWMAGMPSRVTARAWRALHDAQVEDDLMAMIEWPGGARGMVVASNCDVAGDKRIDIYGDRAAVFAGDDRLRKTTYAQPIREFTRGATDQFAGISSADEEFERPESEAIYLACHRDFVDAIAQDRAPLNHPAEATRAVEFANAVYLSALTGEPVDLPLDLDRYEAAFADMCAGTRELPRR